MKTYNVLVVSPFEERHKELLEKEYFHVTYRNHKQCEDALFEDADIIIGNPLMEQIHLAKNLKLLQLGSAGSDGFHEPSVLPKDCILCNATGSYGLAISEHMLGVTLMLMKKFHRYMRNQQKHFWKSEGSISSIYGSTFLIVGLGDIGSEFARKVKALGGYTIGIKRHVDACPAYLDELYGMDALETLLPRADVVTLSLPSTKETKGIFTADCFQQMKKSAFLVNVGRGDVMRGEDLLHALQHHEIAGAAIDVYEEEPMHMEDALWEEENIIITPHIAGNYHLPETFERFVRIAVGNVEHFYRQEPLQNVVDVHTGYRTYKK